jgi:hypothetical protein
MLSTGLVVFKGFSYQGFRRRIAKNAAPAKFICVRGHGRIARHQAGGKPGGRSPHRPLPWRRR